MSATSEHSSEASVEELQARIEATRHALAEDLESLGQRVAPDAIKQAIKDGACDSIRSGGERARQVASEAWESARDFADDLRADDGVSPVEKIRTRASALLSDAKKGDKKAIAITATLGVTAVACIASIRRIVRH